MRLPRGALADAPFALQAAQSQALQPAAGGLVLVIDDDAANRAAMASLLAAWGYTTLCADGLADLTPQIMQLREPPVLLISDLRLRGAERGTEVVAQLREMFNTDLPAIIVSGDTAKERVQEVGASGLQLLSKPISEQTLRAAVAEALKSAASAS